MNATVFYAWQSDRPRKITRDLIGSAAEAACKRISEDTSNPWNLALDSDTQGVAGMCDIPNTILEKIKTCAMLLADLTFVGRTDDPQDGQQIPNPNVLFELGFAANCLGFDPLIGVMNEAYGKKDGQVFDIKRRASVSYSLGEDAASSTITKEQERLSRRLEEVFRTTLEKVVAPRTAVVGVSREQTFKELQSDFAARVKQGKFHNYAMIPATLLTIQSSVGDALEYNDLYERVRTTGRNLRPSEEAMNWSHGCQVVELATDGILFHAYGGVYELFKRAYQAGLIPYARLHPGEPTPRFLPTTHVQMAIVSHAFEQCKLLETLKLPPPWLIGVSLVGGRRLLPDYRDNEIPEVY